MFEEVLGRLMGGALWGLGAGIVLNVVRGREEPGAARGAGQQTRPARPVVKSLMRAYVATTERVRETAAEARESVEDLYAEVKAERRNTPVAVAPDAAATTGRVSPARRAAGRSGTSRPARARASRASRAAAASPAPSPATDRSERSTGEPASTPTEDATP